MTDKQIQAAKRTLRLEPNQKRTPEQQKLSDELWCRDMINSILAYGDESDLKKDSYQYETYLEKYESKIGTERVQELITEQIADFRKATLIKNVFTDDEGLCYNSIVWGD